MLAVAKKSYNGAKTYGRAEAFDILGSCSLESLVLVDCDENGHPVVSESTKELGLVWLSANRTTWLRALWPHSAQVHNVLTL